MKTFMHCDELYQDIDSLQNLVTSMEFKSMQFGDQIPEFCYIPAGLEDFFSLILGNNIEIQPDTGFFRKSNDLVHVEPFYQHCLWTVVAALEDTKLYVYDHVEDKNFFDVVDKLDDFVVSDCTDKTRWKTRHELLLKKNEFVFLRPIQWFSLEINKLVQVFLLNHKTVNR